MELDGNLFMDENWAFLGFKNELYEFSNIQNKWDWVQRENFVLDWRLWGCLRNNERESGICDDENSLIEKIN